jgi:hypothetical protein
VAQPDHFLHTLHAELIAEVRSPQWFAEAGRDWLTDTMAAVFPDLLDGLEQRPVTGVARRVLSGAVDPPGEPGQVLGTLRVSFAGPVSWESVSLFSARSWKNMLASLDRHPFTVLVQVRPLDGQGRLPRDGHSAVIEVSRAAFEPAWAQFSFSASAEGTGWPGSPELQAQWAAYVQGKAAALGACAGSITDDIGPGSGTALQRLIGGRPAPISAAVTTLRGYSWVTVVASEPASRLGGADTLAATGAFDYVSRLPDGSLWLRATPTISDFTGERVRRVFEALAPVLITGKTTPSMPIWRGKFRIIEDIDAADYQA